MIGLIVMVLASSTLDPRCSGRVKADPPTVAIVGSAKIAAQIGEAYLAQLYGEDTIHAELPLHADLVHGVWHVIGAPLPVPTVGGVGEIDICQSTGRVLRAFHGE